jgi:type I restriction enzyme, S subunit
VSRIEDLIKEHCPNGVEYSLLGEVVRIRNGKDYKALGEGTIPVYGTGGIMARVDTSAYALPSVLIPRKGSLNKLYYVDEPFWTVDTIFYTEIGERIIPKFLYFFLQTLHLEEMNQAGGVPSLTQAMLNMLRIPIPPIEVQREIVRILDTFSKLEAELKARRKQYTFYRDQLLNLANHYLRKRLGDLAIIGTGNHDTQDATIDGRYVFYARGREPLRLDSFDFEEKAIITAGDGVGVGKVFHFADGKYALHQRAYRIVPESGLEARYLYHYLKHDFHRYLQQISVHASVTSLRRPMFLKYPVPVPPLDEQKSIAAALDRFDALVNDLSTGLPAELNARRKQYEHYRDRLLTFQEAG